MFSKNSSSLVAKKLKRNKPAMWGMYAIVVAILMAFFAYPLMPDSSTNANEGAVEIRKLPLFSKVTVIKVRKNKRVEDRSFFVSLFNGKNPSYSIIPIEEYKIIDSSMVEYSVYGSNRQLKEKISLISIVNAISTSSSLVDTMGNSVKYLDKGNALTYLDVENNTQSVTKKALIDTFIKEHVDTRIYWLGTDIAGRDLLSRLILGTRISLSIGAVAVSISLLIGLTLGACAGFFRGWIDEVIMWFTTVIWSIPGIMLVIAISMVLQQKGVWVAFLAVGLTMWVEVARIVRGQVMEVREKLFIEAARAFGMSTTRIIIKHILPNIAGPLIVVATANFASAILIEAGLSFLGLGVQPPTPSWGMMVHEGFKSMTGKGTWNLLFFPGISISILVFAFNLLGNGLRDALDPK